MKKLISIEDQVIKATIKALLDDGYILSVNDGEETTVTHSTDPDRIFTAMKTTGEDYLMVHVQINDSIRPDITEYVECGWVRFIYGNEGTEVINDYSVSLEPVIGKIMKLISDYEEGG